jgi:hypothetical protein
MGICTTSGLQSGLAEAPSAGAERSGGGPNYAIAAEIPCNAVRNVVEKASASFHALGHHQTAEPCAPRPEDGFVAHAVARPDEVEEERR